jgi:hypothetical protein
MSESRFPAGWDADRVKRLIDHFGGRSEDEQVAENETAMAAERRGQAVIAVPDELLPEIRPLLAAYQAESARVRERFGVVGPRWVTCTVII